MKPGKRGRMKPGNSKGFTLVESLVVIGIVVLLAALIFPAIRSMEKRGLEAKCASNLRQIGSAWASYVADNGGKLPPAVSGSGPWSEDFWTKSLSPYLGFEKVLAGNGNAYTGTVAFCPGNTGKRYHMGEYSALSYIPNGMIGGVFSASGEIIPRLMLWPNDRFPVATTIASIPQPSKTLLFASAKQEMLRSYLDGNNPGPYLATHFHGGGNILFCDGHVERFVPTNPDGSINNKRAIAMVLGGVDQ